MKKGFSLVTAIVSVFALLVLGFGAYTGYAYFTNPYFDFYGLIQRGPSAEEMAANYSSISGNLTEYVKGANADALIFYQRDEDLMDYLQPLLRLQEEHPEYGGYIKPTDVVAAMAVVKMDLSEGFMIDETALNDPSQLTENAGFILAVEFTSNEAAEAFSASILPAVALLPGMSLDVYDTVFVAMENPDILEGNIFSNPLIAKIDQTHGPKADFIALFDTEQNYTYTLLPFALVNTLFSGLSSPFSYSPFMKTANAQLLSPSDQSGRLTETTPGEPSADQSLFTGLNSMLILSTYIGIYADYDDPGVTIALDMDFLEKDQIRGRIDTLIGIMGQPGSQYGNFEEGLSEFEDLYDQTLPLMDEAIEELNATVDGLEARRVGNNFSVAYTTEVPPLNPVLDAPKRARNAARMADVNNWIVAIESYAADTGDYPDTSACAEDLAPLLSAYFPSRQPPTDFDGEQTFATSDGSFSITCDSGFFYQYFGDRDYAMWAKLESFEGSPPEGKEFIIDKSEWETAGEGPYHASMHAFTNKPGKMVMNGSPDGTTKQKGVSRGVPRVAP